MKFLLFGTTLFFTMLAMILPAPTQSLAQQALPTAAAKSIVFFGDSITELGINPSGYITKIKQRLAKENVGSNYELLGAGVSGNKVYDLFLRLDDDVLRKNPSAVVIFVGVNDVWHKALLGTGTDANKFEVFYVAIIKKLQEKSIKVILCTPAVIGERTDSSNPQDGDLNHYSNIIRRLAQKYSCSLCDFRKAFLEYNLTHNSANAESGILTNDRVHLNDKGNQLVADMLFPVLFGK